MRYFFFLMIRRPPRSTLFPYTSSSDLTALSPDNRMLMTTISKAATQNCGVPNSTLRSLSDGAVASARRSSGLRPSRSEEHTSELQSPDHIVCRLLLEKKKELNWTLRQT